MSNELIDVLRAASSQDVNLVKLAEEKIEFWQSSPGFASMLLDVFIRKDLDVPVRWMAIICLKNTVQKYWRRCGKIGIPEDEKNLIRSKIMLDLEEPVGQLAVQLAVVIAKIVRVDVQIWPEAIQIALQGVKSDKSVVQHRSLLILNRIMNELASKRLMSDRKIFENISASIFNYLHELSSSYSTFKNAEDFLLVYDMYILVTKVLRKILIYGTKKFQPDSEQALYLHGCFKNVSLLLQIKNNLQCKEKAEKSIILFMKIFSDCISQQPLSFVALLEPAIILCLETIMTASSSCDFKLFLIYCGNLLKDIIISYKKQAKVSIEKSEPLLTASVIKSKWLSDDCVEKLCNYIIYNYFPLNQQDLEEWLTNPEDYTIVEAGESHKFLLGPCMEALFVSLFYEYKSIVIPRILQSVNDVNNIGNPNSMEVLLKCCAVLKAVGLSSYELFDDLDFDCWFQRTLLPILRSNGPNQTILHQHVIWLIGCWINVKFSKANRITLYEILCSIIQNETDVVIKITACKTLHTAIDDFDFEVDTFTPYANNIFTALCKLLAAVELCDLKMSVLSVISLIIERLNRHVANSLDLLIQYLPQLWEISVEHNLLRGAVINVLVHVVKGLGFESDRIWQITLPVILFSTSVDQPAHVYLLEDGLELFLSVIQNSKTINEDILVMFKNILALYERASETFDLCLSITKAYLILDAISFLKIYSSNLCQVFSELLDYVKEPSVVKITQIVKLSVLLVPKEAIIYFQKILFLALDCVIRDTNSPPVMNEYITTLACVCLLQPNLFSELISSFASLKQSSVDDLMDKLLDVWLEKIDCMPLEQKKCTALALSSLLPHKAKFVYNRIALILDLCVNVMFDLQKCLDADSSKDYLVTDREDRDDESTDAVSCRDREILSKDPAHTIVFHDFCRNVLNECKTSYGELLFNEAIEAMDSAVAKQLMTLIS
nr:importin-11 [Hydra vulgaris]